MGDSHTATRPLAGEYACFAVRGEYYGVKTSQVSGVYRLPPVRKTPKAPDFVEGVSCLRGRIVPVLDAARRFGLSSSSEKKPDKLALLSVDDAAYGLIVDGLSFISEFSESAIEPVNPILTPAESSFLSATALKDDRLVHLLDVGAFLFSGLALDEKKQAVFEQYSADMARLTKRRTKKRPGCFFAWTPEGSSTRSRCVLYESFCRPKACERLRQDPTFWPERCASGIGPFLRSISESFWACRPAPETKKPAWRW